MVIFGIAIAGSVYFYGLSQQGSGTYAGPGLPNQATVLTYSVSANGYGNWASYAFHLNVTKFTAENAMTNMGGVNPQSFMV